MVAASAGGIKRRAHQIVCGAAAAALASSDVIARTRVKICGVRRPEDALAAARAGADAIGLVFDPSAPRRITLDDARAILAVLPAFVTPVALFVNSDLAALRRTIDALRLRHVQLNGNEPAEYVAELRDLAVIKAVRVEAATFGRTLSAWRAAAAARGLTNLKGLVLETAGTSQPGGTGVPNDWATVRHHQAAGDFDGLPPVIAAGGLTPDTVAAVVRDLRPWAVDVSSGVEESRGIKSPDRIAAFIGAVRRVDATATA